MRNLKILLLLLIGLSFLMAQKNSVKVLVVYHSETGHTKQLAEAVADGAKSVHGVIVELKTIAEATTDDILSANAIILGSPVHNANTTPAVQQFIDSWPFKGQPLKDKIGAAFVSAGGISAGEELTQMNILHSMLINSMIVVGGPDWHSAFGASFITEEYPAADKVSKNEIEKYYLSKGAALGKRVAILTLLMAN